MAHLIGVFRLGRDAEKHSNDKGDFLTMSLAYDVYENGENRTQWIRGTLGGSRVEKSAGFLIKGARISAVIKDPRVIEYQDKEGKTRSALEGRIFDFEFISAAGKKEESASEPAAEAAAE